MKPEHAEEIKQKVEELNRKWNERLDFIRFWGAGTLDIDASNMTVKDLVELSQDAYALMGLIIKYREP